MPTCPSPRLASSALALLLLASLCLAGPARAAEPIGKVISMTGSAKAVAEDGADRALDLDSPVFARERLVTGRASNIEVRLADETLLAQGPDSTITLDEYVFSNDPGMSKLLFKMGAGTFRFLTGRIVQQNPEGFNLETPLTTIGIRGTEPFAVVAATEQIGLLSIDPHHTMEVATARGAVSMNRTGTSVNVGPDGGMTPPAPTPPSVRNAVMQAAPMTSQGEVGPKGQQDDRDRKVRAFKENIAHSKSQLGDVSGRPDYGALHNIGMQNLGEQAAESQRDGTDGSMSGLGSDSGSDSGGGGESGGGEGGHQ
ncbi:FecR domain-containing protein [Pseudodesulfovibrio sp.]|uniref:FecR family protein n=1 Tax=Pseudodesulfovibrio sp. TaxID=2035812 RepID=UPI002608A7C6|nr:FecR domain-containing protein [Pseudodesulfovibrio sp.]MDD3311241.1 FecR domain-containing protein [Pseudodesulfovibrio sp.]